MRVASLGSVNVDCVRRLSAAALASLVAEHDPFPAAGETLSVASAGDLPPPDETRLGGKGANQAVAAARAGSDAALLGVVGPDAPDHRVRETLTDRGVDATGLETGQADTGKAHVFVAADGENRILVVPGANDGVDSDYVARHRGAVLAADALLLQNEIPVPAMDALLTALDGRADAPIVVLDPAPPAGVAPLLAHPAVSYVTPNEHEYDALAAAGALDGFDGTVIQTRGADEVRIEGAAGAFAVSPPPAEPVDTTGAGDAFAGVLATRLAAGDDLGDAVALAAAAGALATERAGAQSPPTLSAIRRRLRG
ncbi:MAG: PfkB family carbohydrate kinase [Haloarculaceae archaeon]